MFFSNLLNRRAIVAGMTLGLLGAASFVGAQSVDEIIENNLKAIGGRDAIAKIKAIERKGDTHVEGQFGPMDGTTETKALPGKKAYSMMDLGVFYRTSGWDGGDKGWDDNPMGGVTETEGPQLQLAKAQSQINPFIGIKETGAKLTKIDDAKAEKVTIEEDGPATKPGEPTPTPKPKETVDCYVLELTSADAKPEDPKIHFYIDKKTNLIFQNHLSMESPQSGEAINVTVEYTEYQEVEGVKVPKIMKVKLGDMATMETTYTETKVNGEIDDKVFAKPTPPPTPTPRAPGAGVKPGAGSPSLEKK